MEKTTTIPPTVEIAPEIKLYNADCMEIMSQYPDNYFDLAIVDPPYGVGDRFNFRWNDDENKKVYENTKPEEQYWNELFRVSENQIVWGGNYFTDFLHVNRCWFCWYKHNPVITFSDIELAWTSLDKVSRCIDLVSYGFNHGDTKMDKNPTIHPTQKPVRLYEWILKNYAQKGQKILDTHLGSGSHAIAAHYFGVGEFIGCEIDKDYFEASVKRIKEQTAQLKIF